MLFGDDVAIHKLHFVKYYNTSMTAKTTREVREFAFEKNFFYNVLADEKYRKDVRCVDFPFAGSPPILMRVTVETIAKEAGVSRGTVDRVLHNRPNVRPEVRDRILEVMDRFDYKPNEAASALAFSRRTRKVGIILPQWKGFFKEEIYRGINDAEKELNGYGIEVLIVECPAEKPESCAEQIDVLAGEGIVGLCLCAQDHSAIRQKISSLAAKRIPTITYNSDIEGSERICFVGQDLLRSGRIAAEIMTKCISRDDKVLVVVGDMHFAAHRQRVTGFFERMLECGVERDSLILAESFNDYGITLQAVKDNLQKHSGIRGIYMANESVAACAEAVNSVMAARKPCIICHDLSRSTRTLLKAGTIDFVLEQDIYSQGYRPLLIMRNFLTQSNYAVKQQEFIGISIANSESVD